MALGWQELHSLLGLTPEYESDASFVGVAALDEAKEDEVSFLGNPRYQPQLAGSKAGVVIVPEGNFEVASSCKLIVVENPSKSFSKVINFFQALSNLFHAGISPQAHVSPDARVDPLEVAVAAGAVIGQRTQIGRGTSIGSGCQVGSGVQIGEDCVLHPGVVVRENCSIGDRVILQPGCVIGSDGYGFDFQDGRHQKIPQVGIVEIQDDVEVGANSCIDRARFGKTVIGEGTKIDNLVQVAHNARIGKHCLLVAQSGIAGSTRLGNYTTIAAQAGVAGHLEIGDQVILTAQSGFLKDIPESGVYMGTPARPIRKEQRKMATLNRLPKLMKEVKELKKRLENLERE